VEVGFSFVGEFQWLIILKKFSTWLCGKASGMNSRRGWNCLNRVRLRRNIDPTNHRLSHAALQVNVDSRQNCI
jgi:hypothetical protein